MATYCRAAVVRKGAHCRVCRAYGLHAQSVEYVGIRSAISGVMSAVQIPTDTVPVIPTNRLLTAARFHRLADVPPVPKVSFC